jgi:hypothetical protein
MMTYTPEALMELATFIPKTGLRQLLVELNASVIDSTLLIEEHQGPPIFLRHSADRQRDPNSVQLS